MGIRFTIGIKKFEDIKEIKNKGLSTVYCGYLENKATKKWPSPFCTLNRRGEDASVCGKLNFKKFATEAEKYKINIYVTFNGLYTPEQYDWVLSAIKYVSSFNSVSGIIVNDMGLLLRLKQIKYNKQIVISTGGTTFNSSTVSFYKQFNITRVVLDRQLKTEEIISILENHKDIDFEIFLTFGNCLFVDGFCSLLHVFETQEKNKKEFYNVSRDLAMCGIIHLSQLENKYQINNKHKNKYKIKFNNNIKYSKTGCNICNIGKLTNFSDRIFYKIVSRGNIFINEFGIIKPFLKELFYIKNEKDKDLIFNKIFKYSCNKTGCYANEKII